MLSAPPEAIQFKFHRVTGKNIALFEDGLYARRINPDTVFVARNAIVYGSQPIVYGGRCIFEVVIAEYDDKRSKYQRSVQIGVRRLPSSMDLTKSDIPDTSEHGDNHCIWADKKVWNRIRYCVTQSYCSVDLLDLRQG